MIYTEQNSNRNEQENWDISILLFKLDFNKFKQTHGHQKLEKPKKKKKLFKVRHSTSPYREEQTKLKGFENLKKKIQKLYININVQYEIANLDLD